MQGLRKLADDRGGIVIGWLTKIIVVSAVIGVIGFDLISIGVGRLNLEDDAGYAGREGRDTYNISKDLQQAYDAAEAEALGRGSTIDASSFQIGSDGVLRFTMSQTVDTLLLKHVGLADEWIQQSYDMEQSLTGG